MKTFARVALATFSMIGLAQAQPAKAPTPVPPPAKPDAAKKAPDVKVDAKVDAKVKVDPNAKPAMAMPKPPQELADMGKMVSGTWRCKGESNEMDGSKKPMTATNRTKVDLDKWWIVDTFDGKAGTGATATAFKFVAYTTFDAQSKKWRRVMIDNWGGHMVGTSDGMKDNKMTFNMDSWSPMGTSMFRDHTDATDTKAGIKFSGEMSMDKGKTWNKVYEMTCKK